MTPKSSSTSAATRPEEYLEVVERLAAEEVDLLEINISCPNVNAGFLAFGQDPKHVEALTAEIKKKAKQPVIMKLTPNVTDIAGDRPGGRKRGERTRFPSSIP